MWKSCNEEQFNQFQMPFSRQHSRKKIRARINTHTQELTKLTTKKYYVCSKNQRNFVLLIASILIHV